MGILARGGEVRVAVVSNRRKSQVQQQVREQVLAGSAIFTDALKSYEGLNEFQHEVVDHAVEYVRGEVHTNGLENLWSLVKRGLNGTYVSVEPFASILGRTGVPLQLTPHYGCGSLPSALFKRCGETLNVGPTNRER
jgi:hypothetical protein